MNERARGILVVASTMLSACMVERSQTIVDSPDVPAKLAAERSGAIQPLEAGPRPGSLLASAAIAIETHRFREAADFARRATEQAPDDSTGSLLLGDALLELGEYEAAASTYQRAMDILPDSRSFARAARMRWLFGDAEGAQALMRAAVRMSGAEAPRPRHGRALALETTGATATPPVVWYLVELGSLLLETAEDDKALEAAEAALGYAPDDARARLLRSRALRQLGRYDEAIASLDAWADAHADVASLVELADLLTEVGRETEARDWLRRAEMQRDEDPAALAVHDLRHALRLEQALEWTEYNLRVHATIEAHAMHALALWRSGRLDEARAASERALRLGTRDAELYLHRALIERDAYDIAGAREFAALAFEINPSVDPRLARELGRDLRWKTP